MKKFIKITGSIVLLIVAIMVLLPFIFKGKLEQIAKEEINKNVNARVDFTGASLSLFKSFPDFRLDLESLQIVGKDKFDADTLIMMEALSLDIDLFSVFRGAPYEIKKIVLNKPNIRLITLPDGSVNYDIMFPSDPETHLVEADSASGPFTLRMNAILINQGKLLYDDQSLNFNMLVDDVVGIMSGNFSSDLAEIQTELMANNLSMTYEGFRYLSNIKTEFSSLIMADMNTSTYTLKNTEVHLNQLPIDFEGSFVLGEEDYTMDLSFKSKDNNFKSLLSLLPVVYLRQFEQVKAEGAFALEGSVKGIYSDTSMPGFAIDLKVDNASVRYPDLPKSIEAIFVSLNIMNQTGVMDETNIDLNRFQMTIAGNPIEAKLHLKTPVSDPNFNASINGKLDLNSLADVIPLKPQESLKGNLDFDLSLKAKMSDIDNKRYNLIEADGSLTAQEINYISSMFGLPIEVRKAVLAFSPATVDLSQMDILIGKSNLKGSGRIDDFLPYYLSDGVLKGKLNLKSSLIDVNELLAGIISDTTTQVREDTAKLSLNLPERIDFSFSAQVEKMVYEKYVLSQVTALINYKDQMVSFNPLLANLNGGTVKMTGEFDGSDIASHPFNFDFNINSFDIFQAYQTTGLFRKAVPIAEKTKGQFSAGFRLKGKMDKDLNLSYETLQGKGTLQTSQISIESVKTMEQLATLLGNEKYSRLITDGLNFSFEILNGKVYQKPFKIRYADTDVTIGGNIGFDQSLDYDLIFQIPFEALGSNVQSGISKLIRAGANLGIPINPGTSVQVRAKINGLVTDPKVSLDYLDFMSELKNDFIAKVNQELDKQKEELTQKAKAEAEKLISEAKKQGDALIAQAELAAAKVHDEAVKAAELAKTEANKQADRLVDEVSKEGMIVTLAAQEAAKKVRLEGDKSAAKLVQEADKEASYLVNQARLQANELINKAKEKAEKL